MTLPFRARIALVTASLLVLSGCGNWWGGTAEKPLEGERIDVLRGGSNYTMQPPGVGAAENLLKENDGYAGLAASLENIYIVGSIVMDELLDNWDQYSVAVPGSQNDSDANAQQ